MKMKPRKVLMVGALLAITGPAMARDFSYTYGQVDYQYVDGEVGNIDFDGDQFGVQGSVAIAEQLFIDASYAGGELDFDNFGEVDVEDWSIGFGGHLPLQDNIDLVAGISLVGVEVENDSETGYGLDLGVRIMPVDQFEIAAGIGYTDVDDQDSFDFGAEGRYYFTDAISAGASISTDDEGDAVVYGLNLRAQL